MKHHANLEVPHRCFVRLFKMYQSLCPPDAPEGAFYLQPAHKPTPTCWFSRKPLGHNTLAKTVSRMCSSAGIEGYKTNHSLRATSTSRLYHSGVDEQLVMERTGHKSTDGVRSYKRTSESQREALSDILNRKKPRVEEPSTVPIPSSATTVVQTLTFIYIHRIKITWNLHFTCKFCRFTICCSKPPSRVTMGFSKPQLCNLIGQFEPSSL